MDCGPLRDILDGAVTAAIIICICICRGTDPPSCADIAFFPQHSTTRSDHP